jgi:hypothetical protein
MKRLLPFLLILLCSAALAESGAYRVEVIVFRNLEVMADSKLAEELRSFSQFPSLEEIRLPMGQLEEVVDELPSQPPADVPDITRYDLPDDLNVITQKGTSMSEVWRRLRSSQGYRPLLYAAWEQNRTDYYPPMRVHDQQIIDTQLRPPTQIMVADLAAQDPLAANRRTFYRLDGTVQLRRSRFLHLFIDLEYREEKPVTPVETDFLSGTDRQAALEDGHNNNVNPGVFSLKQNRQIRTGQMQYFDTPYFGALVLVSAIAAH